ncbi:hypothetical protein CsSME_00024706 [Camellia sinensis var. sinensis]
MLISCCISFYDTTLLKAKEIYDNMMYILDGLPCLFWKLQLQSMLTFRWIS